MERHVVGRFCVRNRLSIWMVFFSIALTATMMHPSFSAMMTLFLNAGWLFALRTVAHLEGRFSPQDT